MAVLAAVLVSGCDKESEPCPKCLEEMLNKNNIELYVSAATVTKVADASPAAESKINRAILYVFDAATGLLNSSYSDTTGHFSLTLADGRYDFAVLVNRTDPEPVGFADLRQTVVSLGENRPGSFVMYGAATDVDIISSRTLTLTARRLVSKVNYRLAVDWENKAYRDREFVVKGAYMSNVAGDALLGGEWWEPQEWYNRMFHAQSASSDLLYGNESCVLEDGDALSSIHTFYVLPNPCEDCHVQSVFTPRCTRLVVEARLDGETYYYPVTLPGIEPNTAYEVNLTVRGPGMRHPEDESIAVGALDIAVRVCDWESGETIKAEF